MALGHLGPLELLNLAGNRFGPRGVAAALSPLGGSGVAHLDLSHNRVGAAGAEAVAKLLESGQTPEARSSGAQAARSLWARECRLGDRGAAALAKGLCNAGELLHLDLTGSGLGAKGAAAVASALAGMPALQYLGLGWNQCGPAGVAAVARAAIGHESLHSLDIGWNAAGSHGTAAARSDAVTSLARLLRTSEVLTHLDVSHNALDAAAVGQLGVALQQNRCLVGLHCHGNAAFLNPMGTLCALSQRGDTGFAGLASAHFEPSATGSARPCLLDSHSRWLQHALPLNRGRQDASLSSLYGVGFAVQVDETGTVVAGGNNSADSCPINALHAFVPCAPKETFPCPSREGSGDTAAAAAAAAVPSRSQLLAPPAHAVAPAFPAQLAFGTADRSRWQAAGRDKARSVARRRLRVAIGAARAVAVFGRALSSPAATKKPALAGTLRARWRAEGGEKVTASRPLVRDLADLIVGGAWPSVEAPTALDSPFQDGGGWAQAVWRPQSGTAAASWREGGRPVRGGHAPPLEADPVATQCWLCGRWREVEFELVSGTSGVPFRCDARMRVCERASVCMQALTLPRSQQPCVDGVPALVHRRVGAHTYGLRGGRRWYLLPRVAGSAAGTPVLLLHRGRRSAHGEGPAHCRGGSARAAQGVGGRGPAGGWLAAGRWC